MMAVALGARPAAAQAAIGVNLRENDIRAINSTIGPRPTKLEGPAAQGPSASGNPLWGIPLGALSATLERPLFSPSRRPPPVVTAAPPIVEMAPPPAEPPPLEHPLFSLVGTVIDGAGNQGIFMDQASNAVVRLHIGESESGWVLRAVDARTTTLEKNKQRVTLALPAPNSTPGAQPPGFLPPPPRGF